MIKIRFGWVAGLLLAVSPVAAQDSLMAVYPEVPLQSLFSSPNPEVREEIQSISENWVFIGKEIENLGVASRDYVEAMEYNNFLIQLATTTDDPDLALEIIRDVENDLSVKSNFIRASSDFSLTAFTEVDVSVITLQGVDEAHGYMIGFSPRRHRGGEPLYRFNNPSSPTEGTLPPGIYEVIATKGDQVVSRQEATVGESGKAMVTIKVLVP